MKIWKWAGKENRIVNSGVVMVFGNNRSLWTAPLPPAHFNMFAIQIRIWMHMGIKMCQSMTPPYRKVNNLLLNLELSCLFNQSYRSKYWWDWWCKCKYMKIKLKCKKKYACKIWQPFHQLNKVKFQYNRNSMQSSTVIRMQSACRMVHVPCVWNSRAYIPV